MEPSIASMTAVFVAGIVSFLSPCVLPLVPGYVSYIAGHSIPDSSKSRPLIVRVQALALSVCFVLGFATIFVILGASATALGQALISYRYELNLIGGVIVIGFGLFATGLLHPSWLQRDFRVDIVLPGGRPAAAYLLGMAFAFGWTPCIGPVLGAILTISATTATVAEGVKFLAIYSLGLGIPFLLVAAFTGGLLARLKSVGRVGRILQIVAGSIMVLMGAAIITGQLSTFSFWLLETFPLLSTIG
jgi:cytochrome c-type biogenesis protein